MLTLVIVDFIKGVIEPVLITSTLSLATLSMSVTVMSCTSTVVHSCFVKFNVDVSYAMLFVSYLLSLLRSQVVMAAKVSVIH